MSFINYPNYIKKTWLFLYKLGNYSGCHQMSERSFRLFDMQFPICARCTGVLIGEILTLILIKCRVIIDIKLNLLFLFIMFMDWFIQYVKIKESSNLRRFITGFLCGVGLVGIYFQLYILVKNLLF
jgi:uncharacterized membrane protein